MYILTENEKSTLVTEYPIQYHIEGINMHLGHEEMADLIAKHPNWKTLMIVCCCDLLADEHWDDPAYIHKTNHIWTCRAREEARKELMNRYFSDEQMTALMTKYELLDWEYNYKKDDEKERSFRRRLEDQLFEFQEFRETVKIINSYLNDCKYKMDDDGYVIENEDENAEDTYILETDPDKVEKQREQMLERLLMPRVHTEHNRVYDMPQPLSHWDSRSSYHHAFYVEMPDQMATFGDRGNCGSSGARETNGRWCHTFACLATKYGIETPTVFMRYNRHNVWQEVFRLPTFATLGRDLSGNYFSTREIMAPLFKDRIYDIDRNDQYEYSYVKRTDDVYY